MKKFISYFPRIAIALLVVLAISIISEKRTIDYLEPLDEVIKKGDYTDISLDLNNYEFKKSGKERIELNLFPARFLKDGDPMSIIDRMDASACRPANIIELLHYKTLYKDPGLDIIALGSVSFNLKGEMCSPIIIQHKNGKDKSKYSLSEIPISEDKNIFNKGNKKIAFLAVYK